MALNIGTLVGYLQLDDTKFSAKADNADRKINALKLHLEALGRENPKISVEVATQTAELDRLKARLDELKAQSAQGVDVRVDAVQALIEIDRVQTKIRELHGKTVRVDVKTNASSAANDFERIGGSLRVLPALAVAGTAALIPLLGVVGGISAALAAPLLLTAGGATVFGLLAGLAAHQTEKQLKNIDQLRQHLGTLTKGTAEYAAAQGRLRRAEAALTPEQKKFADSQDRLKGAFQKFLGGSAGKTLLDVMAQGMDVLSHLLPVVAPLIEAVGHGMSILLGDVDKAAQGSGLAQFVDQISRLVGPDIVSGGHILMNLAGGVGGLLLAISRSKLSHESVQGLVTLTENFDKWSNSSAARHDVRDLFEYVHKVGPQVGHTLGAIAGAAGHLVSALAPLGPPILKVVEGIANAISGIPVPVLTALAAAFIAITAAAKVGSGISKITGGLGGIPGLGGRGGALGSFLGGVQKVYVVNMPPGGGGEGGGLFSKILKRGAPGAAGAEGATALTAPEIAAMVALFGAGAGGQALLTHHELSTAQNLAQSRSPGIYGHGGVPETPAQIRNGPHINYGRLASDANGYLTSTTNKFDALKAHAAQASRQIDLIGPHTQQAAGQGIKAISDLQAHLDSVRDKRLQIILQDQAAIQSLEALQRLRLADKTLTVITRYQQRERGVGPGGGIGHHAGGGWILGPGSPTSDSIPALLSNREFVVNAASAAANAPLIEAVNRSRGPLRVGHSPAAARGVAPVVGGRALLTITNWVEGTGYIEAVADGVHHGQRDYAHSTGGMHPQ